MLSDHRLAVPGRQLVEHGGGYKDARAEAVFECADMLAGLPGWATTRGVFHSGQF
ncbi:MULTISPECIES: hypothetical protein [Rothia]|uniref:hypothetical protein n=1 Tax=Rothia TaxID=32207 RepID=UPI0015D87947|nr:MULTISPECIES: hypothetical protein [Rothia]